jgi:DNA-binding transcriptional MocR family regulator
VPDGVLDLAHAAPPAPPQLHAAYAAALDELPRLLPGTGYDYRGLPVLRARVAERFTARGLSTTADQVLITSGALQGVRLALTAVAGPGDRVLVEQPSYPNGLDVVTDLGARAVPVPMVGVTPAGETTPRTRATGADRAAAAGWDVPALAASLRQTAPRAAYLVPDYQNPTGALMDDADRERVAGLLARGHVTAVVDETLVELVLDPRAAPPRPFAAHARSGSVITVGSASKVFWGGLRVGWVRADRAVISRLAALRSRQDLAGPVLEQLAVAHLLGDLDAVRTHRIDELRRQRDTLVALVRQHLPSWRFDVPSGGQVLWCALPGPWSASLADAAADRGLRITPGSRFSADGTLESSLRLPYTRPAEELEEAVGRLADAWHHIQGVAPRHVPAVASDQFVV